MYLIQRDVCFRREFKRVDELLQQRVKQGGCAYLEQDGRYIYYLVTKRNSYGKPTNETLYRALTKMRSLIEKHNVKKLAMPLIGCGLDGLNWVIVKKMIAYIFRNISIEIRIYQLIDPVSSVRLRMIDLFPSNITEFRESGSTE